MPTDDLPEIVYSYHADYQTPCDDNEDCKIDRGDVAWTYHSGEKDWHRTTLCQKHYRERIE